MRGFLLVWVVMNATDSFIAKVTENIIDPAITLLALGAFLVFAYGIFEMVRGGASDEARKLGQQHMIWGIIGLTILFGARTIVIILQNIVS